MRYPSGWAALDELKGGGAVGGAGELDDVIGAFGLRRALGARTAATTGLLVREPVRGARVGRHALVQAEQLREGGNHVLALNDEVAEPVLHEELGALEAVG